MHLINYFPYFIVFFFTLSSSSSLISQINFEFSFEKYEEEYKHLSEGDTLFGLNDEVWNNDSELQSIQLNPGISIPSFEGIVFTHLNITPYGVSYMAHFDEETMVETIFFIVPLWLEYISPLNHGLNSDQGYVIYKEEDGVIKVEYRNVASEEELFIGDGELNSRFNYQFEYRISDSRVRYLIGKSSITPDMKYFIRDNSAFSLIGIEQWLLEDESQGLWENIDFEFLYLYGDGDDPMLLRPQSIDHHINFSLVSVPPEGTVYEFNISPSSFTSEIDPSEFNWKVWPNPANDFVNLSIESLPDGFTEMDLELYNSKGKLLKSKTIQDSYTLDVKSYTPGVYFITLRSGDFQQTKRWVKN